MADQPHRVKQISSAFSETTSEDQVLMVLLGLGILAGLFVVGFLIQQRNEKRKRQQQIRRRDNDPF